MVAVSDSRQLCPLHFKTKGISDGKLRSQVFINRLYSLCYGMLPKRFDTVCSISFFQTRSRRIGNLLFDIYPNNSSPRR